MLKIRKFDRQTFVFFLLCVFCPFLVGVRALASEAGALPTVGRVVTVNGKAFARGAKSGVRDLKAGSFVYEKDVINTDSQTSVKLLMDDKTIVDLGPTTLFRVDEFKLKHGADRSVGLSMDYGKARTLVNQKVDPKRGVFKVKTRSATMGVRGTEFIVSSDLAGIRMGTEKIAGDQSATSSATQIIVVKGTVDVGVPNAPTGQTATRLTEGTKMVTSLDTSLGAAAGAAAAGASTGAASGPKANVKVQKMNAQEMKSVQSESKIGDSTFDQAVTLETSSSKSEDKDAGRKGPAPDSASMISLDGVMADTVIEISADDLGDIWDNLPGNVVLIGQAPEVVKEEVGDSVRVNVKFSY